MDSFGHRAESEAGRQGDDASAIEEAIDEARAFGTALVGDISNTLATAAACRRRWPAWCFTS